MTTAEALKRFRNSISLMLKQKQLTKGDELNRECVKDFYTGEMRFTDYWNAIPDMNTYSDFLKELESAETFGQMVWILRDNHYRVHEIVEMLLTICLEDFDSSKHLGTVTDCFDT